MLKVASSVNEKKLKLKKNALDLVDITSEKKLDPKYKTEMCKSWADTNFCVYGNKCRFAHGKHEMSSRPSNSGKYKQKDCNSFTEFGFCMYGARCNFKHDERNMEDVDRSFYSNLLTFRQVDENKIKKSQPIKRRLNVFKLVTAKNNLSQLDSPLDLSTHENSVGSPFKPEIENFSKIGKSQQFLKNNNFCLNPQNYFIPQNFYQMGNYLY